MALRGWKTYQLDMSKGVDRREDAPTGTWRSLQNMWSPTEGQIEVRPGAVRFCQVKYEVDDTIDASWAADIFDGTTFQDIVANTEVLLDPSVLSENGSVTPDFTSTEVRVHSSATKFLSGATKIGATPGTTIFEASF